MNCHEKLRGKLGHVVQVDVCRKRDSKSLQCVWPWDFLDDFSQEKCLGYRESIKPITKLDIRELQILFKSYFFP